MLAGMILTGLWVGREFEESVTRNTALSTVLYMESFIAPLAQDLTSKDFVSPETSEALQKVFLEPHFRERIAAIKLWKEDGLIAFSSNPELIGEQFEPSEAQQRAWAGSIGFSFDDHGDTDDMEVEGLEDVPLLEVYNPVHSIYTGEIIAVAELYVIAKDLENDVFQARLRSWLVIAGVTAALFSLLFAIVYRGSRLIERQRATLEQRFDQLLKVSAQNDSLRRRIQAATARASELNERFLRRISAELHDGPAQSVAFASLRVNSLVEEHNTAAGSEVSRIKAALDEALSDIRNICRGLSLPELESSNIEQVVVRAVQSHEKRTNEQVDLSIEGKPDRGFDHPARICVFRFIQETLNNATNHAGGKNVRVQCTFERGKLSIKVSDAGPGFAYGDTGETAGLGLRGLRERIESHGGWFHIDSERGIGTTISMTIDARENGNAT